MRLRPSVLCKHNSFAVPHTACVLVYWGGDLLHKLLDPPVLPYPLLLPELVALCGQGLLAENRNVWSILWLLLGLPLSHP